MWGANQLIDSLIIRNISQEIISMSLVYPEGCSGCSVTPRWRPVRRREFLTPVVMHKRSFQCPAWWCTGWWGWGCSARGSSCPGPTSSPPATGRRWRAGWTGRTTRTRRGCPWCWRCRKSTTCNCWGISRRWEPAGPTVACRRGHRVRSSARNWTQIQIDGTI